MRYRYPRPRDIGLKISPHLRQGRFRAGFDHGIRGGQLDQVEYLRLSFRMGFRAAKLYARELRRRQGILDFPARFKFRLTAVF